MRKETNNPAYAKALQAVQILQSAGFTAFWAGGCVRDTLTGKDPKDYDIATNASPEEVIKLFPKAITVGQAFAVVRAPVEGIFFEIATFRKDHHYEDGRRPEKISFTNPETDAKRRDFTVNALFYDPITEELHDFVNGKKDIEDRIIRCVGSPDERFNEDHLRMLRAARFTTSLNFTLDTETASAIQTHANLIKKISAERIMIELTRILLESEKAGDAITLLDELGLLEAILPEITALKEQKQPPEFHPEGDVFKHTVIMLNNMTEPSLELAFSVLLHDVGKPPTAQQKPNDRIRFNGHAKTGADMAEKILRRLKASNTEIETITHCIRNHMKFISVQEMRRSTLRKLMGEPTFETELELHRLDCLASNGDLSNYDFLLKSREDLNNEPALPDPWINGEDIIKLGIPEGPKVGKWCKKAFDLQLEGKFKNRNDLLNWLEKHIRT